MHELLTQFGIDWKLLAAQVVNFVILLVILRKFAYGPVMKMLANRRAKIEEGIRASSESEKRLAEAKTFEQKILLKAEQDALGIVDSAREDAAVQEKQMLAAARQKSEQVIASGQKHLEEEHSKLVDEVRDQAETLIMAGLVKVVGKLEPAERDRMLVQEALRELRAVSR